jgi:hypothetical protein
MSSFLLNLARRSAGLAPVAEPEAPAVQVLPATPTSTLKVPFAEDSVAAEPITPPDAMAKQAMLPQSAQVETSREGSRNPHELARSEPTGTDRGDVSLEHAEHSRGPEPLPRAGTVLPEPLPPVADTREGIRIADHSLTTGEPLPLAFPRPDLPEQPSRQQPVSSVPAAIAAARMEPRRAPESGEEPTPEVPLPLDAELHIATPPRVATPAPTGLEQDPLPVARVVGPRRNVYQAAQMLTPVADRPAEPGQRDLRFVEPISASPVLTRNEPRDEKRSRSEQLPERASTDATPAPAEIRPLIPFLTPPAAPMSSASSPPLPTAIEVRIGSIEIRADSTPPPRPAILPAPAAPTSGFDQYRAIRTYRGWSRR